jgi:HEPN domain-containing protein
VNEAALAWIDTARYHLETAEAVLAAKRYLHVGFVCHLVMETTLKAVLAGRGEDPPKSHRLRLLAESGGLYGQMDENQRRFLDLLEPLNIESRYPSDLGQVLAGLTEERCRQIVAQTREFHEWISGKF